MKGFRKAQGAQAVCEGIKMQDIEDICGVPWITNMQRWLGSDRDKTEGRPRLGYPRNMLKE